MASMWQKLSGSINFYIREVWDEKLLLSNEELLNDYLSLLEGEEKGTYEYLDKSTFEYIKLSDEEVERIKKAFLERVEKKKIKFSEKIKELKVKEQEKIKNKSEIDNVIEFKLKQRR